MKKSLDALDPLAHLLELGRVAVRELLRADPLLLGGQLDRLAVLVGAGQEEDVLAPLAHVPREDVGGDRRVRVPEMRLGVDVVDRGGDVEAHGRLSIRSDGSCVVRAAAPCRPPSQLRCSLRGFAAPRGRPGATARPSELDQAFLPLRRRAPAARNPGRLAAAPPRRPPGSRARDARGDDRLRQPVDVHVGAAPLAALLRRQRHEREDPVGAGELARSRARRAAARAWPSGKPYGQRRGRVELVLFLAQLVARLANVLLAVGVERRARPGSPTIAVGVRDTSAFLPLSLAVVDLAGVVEQLAARPAQNGSPPTS